MAAAFDFCGGKIVSKIAQAHDLFGHHTQKAREEKHELTFCIAPDKEGAAMMMTEDHDMGMSNASTTIDPSVVQSRILQSASLAKEDTAMGDADDAEQPTFPQLSAMAARGGKTEYRRVRCPPHRYTPLRENWEQILTPLVEFLKLQASCDGSHDDVDDGVCKGGNLPMNERMELFPESRNAYKPTGKPLCCQEEMARRVSLSDAHT